MGEVVNLASMWDYGYREGYRDTYIYIEIDDFFCEALLSRTKNNRPNFMFGYESIRGGMCRKVCEKIM